MQILCEKYELKISENPHAHRVELTPLYHLGYKHSNTSLFAAVRQVQWIYRAYEQCHSRPLHSNIEPNRCKSILHWHPTYGIWCIYRCWNPLFSSKACGYQPLNTMLVSNWADRHQSLQSKMVFRLENYDKWKINSFDYRFRLNLNHVCGPDFMHNFLLSDDTIFRISVWNGKSQSQFSIQTKWMWDQLTETWVHLTL